MDLLLVRHAIAEPHSTAVDDIDRALTERGRLRFTQAVRGLTRLDLRVGDVLHSPWLRAVQTAELLAPIASGELITTPLLADDPRTALLRLASASAVKGCVAMVGHQPWMSELLAWLAMGTPRAGDNIVFKKGGVAWLRGSLNPGTMELRGLFTPKSLRLLATRPSPAEPAPASSQTE